MINVKNKNKEIENNNNLPICKNNLPIGVFDSGVGGISVLLEAIKELPSENFIYFGDNGNAPYGTKDEETIIKLTNISVDFLLNQNIKALVIACNTATSAAINILRERLDIPVVGMEPAVKPAITEYGAEKVFVMATPATLRLQKFNDLLCSFSEEARIISVPCPGLMEVTEKGIIEGDEVKIFLDKFFENDKPKKGDVVVLGCTHYVFLKNFLKEYFAEGVEIIDGNSGTVKQLTKRLTEIDGLTNSNKQGHISIFTSGEEETIMPVYERLMSLK